MSAPQITDGKQLENVYADLFSQLTQLRRISNLRSFKTQRHLKTPSFHNLFLRHLPLLLAQEYEQAFHNLKKACFYFAHLSPSEDKQVKARYNFIRALLTELDKAEDLLSCTRESADLKILKAVSTIFHLVESLCYREWGLDHPSVDHPQQLDKASSSDAVPSEHDPEYHPPQKVSSKSTDNRFNIDTPLYQGNLLEQVRTNLQQNDHNLSLFDSHNANEYRIPTQAFQTPSLGSNSIFTSNLPYDDAAQQPRPSKYIRNNGKNIMPGARIKETAEGCDIPFDLILTENSENHFLGTFGLRIHHVLASYPDNTCFAYIPVQNIHLLNHHTDNSITEPDKLHEPASVEMSVKVYEAIINRLTKVHTARFREGSHTFLTENGIQSYESRVKINIPILEDCFVRVVHLLWFVEYPLQEALKMCQHDVSGCGLLKVEFEEAVEGTRMIISLAGIVVERDWFNFDERIFKLLDTLVPSEL